MAGLNVGADENEHEEGDIQNVENYDFNAIVTDPPYGLSSTTKGEGVKKLMSRSMEIFAETMKKEQRVVMAVSNPKLVNQPDYYHKHKKIKEIYVSTNLEYFEIQTHHGFYKVQKPVRNIHKILPNLKDKIEMY